MGRDSFIFYRSFYEALAELKPLERLKVYDAICNLALNGEEAELKGISKAIFSLIEPQINANNMRYTAGKKGGAPKGNSNAKKQSENNQKQPMVELGCLKKQPKNNQKQPNENENENENVNVNENENVSFNSLGFQKLTCSEGENKKDKVFSLVEKYFGDEINGIAPGLIIDGLKKFDDRLIETVFKQVKGSGGTYKDAFNTILAFEQSKGERRAVT